MCVCWGMVKVVTFLLKLKGLGLDISRVYGYPCNRRGIEKQMHRKEVFLLTSSYGGLLLLIFLPQWELEVGVGQKDWHGGIDQIEYW